MMGQPPPGEGPGAGPAVPIQSEKLTPAGGKASEELRIAA